MREPLTMKSDSYDTHADAFIDLGKAESSNRVNTRGGGGFESRGGGGFDSRGGGGGGGGGGGFDSRDREKNLERDR
jgi:hypothetical protein